METLFLELVRLPAYGLELFGLWNLCVWLSNRRIKKNHKPVTPEELERIDVLAEVMKRLNLDAEAKPQVHGMETNPHVEPRGSHVQRKTGTDD